MKNEESIELVREYLDYCKDSGLISWIKSPTGVVKSGSPAGRLDSKGYLSFHFRRKKFKAHRVAFAIYHGRWPDVIDHINGIKTDNRIENLRECTHEQNMQNSRVYVKKDKTSKFSGVCRTASKKSPWSAHIRVKQQLHYLGVFSSEIEAHHAYLAAKAELHKFQPTPREAQV